MKEPEKFIARYLQEYAELCASHRHYSNLRFAVFTVFFAVLGGLATVAFGLNAPQQPTYAALLAQVLGLLIIYIFWRFEENIVGFMGHFDRRAKKLEGIWQFQHFRGRPTNRPTTISLTRMLYAAIAILWLIGFIMLRQPQIQFSQLFGDIMNWQTLANIGQFIEAVVVLITGPVILFQLREVIKQTRIESELGITEHTKSINELLLHDDELTALFNYEKGTVFAFILLNNMEQRWKLRKLGGISDRWMAHEATIRKVVSRPDVLATLLANLDEYHPKFIEYLEKDLFGKPLEDIESSVLHSSTTEEIKTDSVEAAPVSV